VTTAVGGDGLIVAGAVAEEVAEFVVASTEALGQGEALEWIAQTVPPFRLLSAMDRASGSVEDVGELTARLKRSERHKLLSPSRPAQRYLMCPRDPFQTGSYSAGSEPDGHDLAALAGQARRFPRAQLAEQHAGRPVGEAPARTRPPQLAQSWEDSICKVHRSTKDQSCSSLLSLSFFPFCLSWVWVIGRDAQSGLTPTKRVGSTNWL
jgi:hypothetical protein